MASRFVPTLEADLPGQTSGEVNSGKEEGACLQELSCWERCDSQPGVSVSPGLFALSCEGAGKGLCHPPGTPPPRPENQAPISVGAQRGTSRSNISAREGSSGVSAAKREPQPGLPAAISNYTVLLCILGAVCIPLC